MAGLLIRMRMAMLRHQSGSWWGWKAWVGILLALILLGSVPSDITEAEILVPAVALLLAVWTLGMVMLSLQSGSNGSDLMPEHFALLPIPPRKLAVGLLAAAFVSPGTIVLMVATMVLPLAGLLLGPAALLISIPALALHVVMVVLLVRVLITVASAALRMRIGVELVALQWALMISLLSVGWVLLGALDDDGLGAWLRGEMPDAVATTVRILPTGWGAVAIGAADEHTWGLVLVALLGLIGINTLLLGAWGLLLRSQITDRPSPPVSRARWSGPIASLQSPMQAAIWREVVGWIREPRSAVELRVAVLSAVLIATIPLVVGWAGFVPFTGAIIVVMGALAASNTYGLEGTSLWLTLMTPGAERVDVRARQWAFLLLFAPLAIVVSIVAVIVSGMHWVWPWLLAFVPGGLLIAAGVMILVAIHGAVPVPESARRSGDLMASGDASGPAYLTLLLMLALASPALIVTWIGADRGSDPLQLAGILLGFAIGAVAFWWCGEHTIGKLEREGPELLALLRHGGSVSAGSEEDGSDTDGMPILTQAALALSWTIAMIAIFPQALIPAAFKLLDQEETAWFLALHLPDVWQWPAIVGMLLLGAAFVVMALRISDRNSGSDAPSG